MKINRRILLQVTAPAVLIGAVLIGSVLVGVSSINRLQANRAHLVSANVAGLEVAQDLEIRIRQLRFHSLLLIMGPTPEHKRDVANDQAEFEATLARAQTLTRDEPDEQRFVAEIDAGYHRYLTEMEEAVRELGGRGSTEDYLRWSEAHPIRHLETPCEGLLRRSVADMEQIARDSEEVGDRARSAMLLLGVLGPLGGLVGGFGVAWGMSRSITRLSVRLRDVHAQLDRDLGSVRLAAEGSFDQLDRQLGQVLERVRDVVRQVQQREHEALRAEQLAAVGQLAAGVAHEVRNPLASIKLLVGAALKAHPPRTLTPEDLGVIYGEVQRLERRVQALLDFARPPELRREAADLKELVGSAARLVQARAGQQNVRVELRLPDAPVTADIDPDQITSVLVNLFLNALDAMPRGGTLAVTLRPAAPGEAVLEVADTGPGLDPSLSGRLFTPFASTKATGTGLGLSVCRRVIQEHGGTLAAANRPEGGARFTVTLPVSR